MEAKVRQPEAEKSEKPAASQRTAGILRAVRAPVSQPETADLGKKADKSSKKRKGDSNQPPDSEKPAEPEKQPRKPALRKPNIDNANEASRKDQKEEEGMTAQGVDRKADLKDLEAKNDEEVKTNVKRRRGKKCGDDVDVKNAVQNAVKGPKVNEDVKDEDLADQAQKRRKAAAKAKSKAEKQDRYTVIYSNSPRCHCRRNLT